ncbi:MAG: hypothetical protein WBG73_01915 [Coleofasciculaceae cyanobacterium]
MRRTIVAVELNRSWSGRSRKVTCRVIEKVETILTFVAKQHYFCVALAICALLFTHERDRLNTSHQLGLRKHMRSWFLPTTEL